MDNATLPYFCGELAGPIFVPAEFVNAYFVPMALSPGTTYNLTAKLTFTDAVDKSTLKASNFVLKTKTRSLTPSLLLEPNAAAPFYQLRFTVRPTEAEAGNAELMSIADGVKDTTGENILTDAIATLPIRAGESEYITHEGAGVEGDAINSQPWGMDDDVPVWTLTFANGFKVRYCRKPVLAGALGTTQAYPLEFSAARGYTIVNASWEGLDLNGVLVGGTDGTIGIRSNGEGWLQDHIFSLYKSAVRRYIVTLVNDIGDTLIASITVE